jgi:hypothetical protein
MSVKIQKSNLDTYFQCLQAHQIAPKSLHKARAHAWLASRPEPDRRVGEAAQAGYYSGKKDCHQRVTTEHTARPSRRKILNHGKHGTTRKGDPNVFPFLCPSVLSVVITCLDNRRAAQRGRTLVERKDTEKQG